MRDLIVIHINAYQTQKNLKNHKVFIKFKKRKEMFLYL